jgi:hypothetical protein
MESQNPVSPDSPVPAPEKASVWEDFLDIFYAPGKVFARRANGNFWIPLLVVAVLIALLVLANRNVMRPIFDAEFARSTAAQMKANPNITADMLDRSRNIGFLIAEYGQIVLVPIAIVVMGFLTWLGARTVGGKITWNSALVIVSYATLPKVVQQVALSIQGLLMDPGNLTSAFSVELGPGRFLNADTAQPMLAAVAHRLDIFVLWSLLLMTIGVAVIGKVSKARAALFGIGLWVLTLLPGILGALRQM